MPLASVVGHATLLGLLQRAVAAKRVPQSLLFAGPDGVGKRTVALALAQAINCTKPTPTADACGACNACRRIMKGQHPDVVLLDRGDEASVKIGPLRTRVLDAAGYRPFEGARRVFIIDDADTMTAQAQDALLKTLEEPPSSAILILVTAYPDSLLATIRSRCRRLRFGPLALADVERVLVEAASMDPIEARRRSAASSGSVAQALVVEEKEFEDDRRAALDLVAAAARGSVAARLQAATGFVKHAPKRRSREAAAARVDILRSLLRDLATLAAARTVPIVNADVGDTLTALASAYPLDRLVAGVDLTSEAATALDRNASPKIVADWLAVSL